jgi:hypothetical protein
VPQDTDLPARDWIVLVASLVDVITRLANRGTAEPPLNMQPAVVEEKEEVIES